VIERGMGQLLLAMFVMAGRCTEEEADAAWKRLQPQAIAEMPSGVLAQMEEAISEVRAIARLRSLP